MAKIVLACLLCLLFSCKKASQGWIRGTVTQMQGCYPNSWLVTIDDPNASKHPFLCDRSISIISSSTTNCGNSVLILDLPSHLRQPGKRIRFSKWEDKGLLCFPSILATHHLEIPDVSAD